MMTFRTAFELRQSIAVSLVLSRRYCENAVVVVHWNDERIVKEKCA